MRNAIYTICGSGGGYEGPMSSYLYLFENIKNIDIHLIDTEPGIISVNVARMMLKIKKDLDKYNNIYLIGWSKGSATVTQVAYFVNTFLKKDYVKGIIYLAPQGAEMKLIAELNCKIALIHGKNDTVLSYTISERLYNYYKYEKEIYLLDNQPHDFSDGSSNICEILHEVIIKMMKISIVQ